MTGPITSPNAASETPSRRADATSPDGRDARGRFAPGNPGGPGNPHAREVASVQWALMEATTLDEKKALGRKLWEMGMEGNVPAARVYLSYVAGKPTPPVEPDALDRHEWQIHREMADGHADFARLARTPDSAALLKGVRVGRFAFGIQLEDDMKEACRKHTREQQRNEQRRRNRQQQRQAADPPSANGGNGGPPPIANGNLSVVPPSQTG